MCTATAFPPIQVCTVGDLGAGQRYYNPTTGATLLVTDAPWMGTTVQVVNLATGQLSEADIGTKLARNAYGALYASRTLNAQPSTKPEPDADEAKNQADAAWPLSQGGDDQVDLDCDVPSLGNGD